MVTYIYIKQIKTFISYAGGGEEEGRESELEQNGRRSSHWGLPSQV